MQNMVYVGRVCTKTKFNFDVWHTVVLSIIINSATHLQHNLLLLLNNWSHHHIAACCNCSKSYSD
jgi:hypothetical protein